MVVMVASAQPSRSDLIPLFTVIENVDESIKGVDFKGNLILPNNGAVTVPFGGGIDRNYFIFDTKKAKDNKMPNDSFDLKDNGNGTTTLSNFFSDTAADTGGDGFTEQITVFNKADKPVAVFRIESDPEGGKGPGQVPEPGTLVLVVTGLASLLVAVWWRRGSARGVRLSAPK
jgi:hypothetical protein